MSASITEYLEAIQRGEPGAQERLLSVVYQSLRQIAANRLHREFDAGGLQPTELVHEAWIRLGGNRQIGWENRVHFFAAAAEAMRRTLIDNARQKKSAKRGGAFSKQVALDSDQYLHQDASSLPLADELLDLNDAMTAFETQEPVKSQVVKLKFYAGLTIAEIADLMHCSPATVERHWAYARAWFFDYMNEASKPEWCTGHSVTQPNRIHE